MATRKLLNFSGGIDSTYCLYDALRRGTHLLVHHIHLVNKEGRREVEAEAVRNILRWIDRRKLPGRYTYVESTFDFGTLGHRVLDVNVWAFLTGVILAGKQNRDITGVIVPRNAESFVHERDPVAGAERSNVLLKTFMRAVAKREVAILLPIANMTKEDTIRALPRELLELSWWCRQPQPDRQPCHRCITCVQVDPVLKLMGA